MADKKTPTPNTQKTTPNTTEKVSFRVLGQYISDLSFECPQPPINLGKFKNNMELEVGVQSTPKEVPNTAEGTQTHEVSIILRAFNKTDDANNIYLFELKYSGLFALENIPQGHIGGLLGVEAPALLFPFARQIFTSTIAASGLQAPLLEPVNFAAIYAQQMQKQQEQQNQQGQQGQ